MTDEEGLTLSENQGREESTFLENSGMPRRMVYEISWCGLVILPKCLVEIAVVAIPNHRGYVLTGERRVSEQNHGPLHSLFQQDFFEGFTGFPGEQGRDIGGMV